MKAALYQIRLSPKKVNVVAKLVRRKSVSDALAILKFLPKRPAPILAKVISSAAANATNNFNCQAADLRIKEIIVGEGTVMRRGTPASRGRWLPMKKRASHITVELAVAAQSIEVKKDVPTATDASSVEKPAKAKKTTKKEK